MEKRKLRRKNLGKVPFFANVRYEDCTDIFHPMSYYLNGGTDLENEVDDRSATPEYDNDEQVAELESEGMSAVPLGDPRESYFSIVERAGVKNASRSVEGAKGKVTESNSEGAKE